MEHGEDGHSDIIKNWTALKTDEKTRREVVREAARGQTEAVFTVFHEIKKSEGNIHVAASK